MLPLQSPRLCCIYRPRPSGKGKVNAVLWRSPLNSKAWAENEHWASSELLLHLLEPVMSRVISTLLFYKSRDAISPPPTLWINENQTHNHTFNFITLPLCEQGRLQRLNGILDKQSEQTLTASTTTARKREHLNKWSWARTISYSQNVIGSITWLIHWWPWKFNYLWATEWIMQPLMAA